MQITVPSSIESYRNVRDFIEESFKKFKLRSSIKNTYMLVAEELFNKIVQFTGEGKDLTVSVARDIAGTCTIRYIFPGHDFELFGNDDDIGTMMLSHYADSLRFKYRDGVNTVSILVGVEHSKITLLSLAAMLVAMVFTMVLSSLIPQETFSAGVEKFIWPIEGMFVRAIGLIAPLVLFFNIVTSIATYFSVMDRYPGAKKLLSGYLLTSLSAIALGILAFYVMKPLRSYAGYLSSYCDTSSAVSLSKSLLNDLKNLIPEDIFTPFVVFNVPQLIIMAVLTGLALGSLGRYTENLREITANLASLLSKIFNMVYAFAPLVVFAAFVESFQEYGTLAVYRMFIILFGTTLIALSLQVLVYVGILKFNKIKLKTFYKKLKPMVIETYRIGSTSDAVPLTIKSCEKAFRIPKKFLNISIPLGATNNLDGSCLCLVFVTLIMTSFVGINLNAAEVVAIAITSFILSLGTPTQSGAFLISFAGLLPSFGASNALLVIPLIFEVFMSQFLAAFNLIGDVVISRVVSKSGKSIL